jgi:hypothetical protein
MAILSSNCPVDLYSTADNCPVVKSGSYFTEGAQEGIHSGSGGQGSRERPPGINPGKSLITPGPK